MQIIHNIAEEAFELFDDQNRRIGEITYQYSGNDAIRVPHTGVSPSYEGRGLAGQLLDALVKWAQGEGLRVIPVCPYVVRAFRKYPDKYAAVM